MRELTVNNTTYEFPDTGANGGSGWSEEVSEWAEAITDKVNGIAGDNDISTTSFTLTNNQSSPTNITGLAFNTSLIRSAEVDITVRISTSLSELSETFKIVVTYENTAGAWLFAETSYGDDSGCSISITSSGQFQYSTTNIAGTSYSGVLQFKAKVFEQ